MPKLAPICYQKGIAVCRTVRSVWDIDKSREASIFFIIVQKRGGIMKRLAKSVLNGQKLVVRLAFGELPKTKIWAVITVLLVGVLILPFGCKKEPKKISFGYVSSGVTGLAVEVMKELKIPEKFGVDLEYVGFTDPSLSNNAFINGKYQVNLAAGVNVIALARIQGYQVQYFFPTLLNSVCVVVKKDSPYQSLDDLKGKKIGWYGLQSGGGTGFYVLAKKKGIDILKEYELIDAKPPALWPLLERAEIQGIVIYDPFVSRMLATDNYRVLIGPFFKAWEEETGYEMEMTGFAATEKWLKTNRSSAEKLIKMWKETVAYIKKNPEEVLRKHQDYTNLKTDREIELGVQRIPPIYVSEWGNKEASIDLMLEMLVKESVIIEEIPEGIINKFGE